MNTLIDDAKASPHLDSSTPENRLNVMIMNVAYHRLFKPLQIRDGILFEYSRRFLKLNFTNKGIDAVNISNILRHEKTKSCIPSYFSFKPTPCISYRYTRTF